MFSQAVLSFLKNPVPTKVRSPFSFEVHPHVFPRVVIRPVIRRRRKIFSQQANFLNKWCSFAGGNCTCLPLAVTLRGSIFWGIACSPFTKRRKHDGFNLQMRGRSVGGAFSEIGWPDEDKYSRRNGTVSIVQTCPPRTRTACITLVASNWVAMTSSSLGSV